MNEIERTLRDEAALASTYDRAIQIIQDGKVLGLRADELYNGYVVISGLVDGSGSQTYEVSVTYAQRGKFPFMYECDCEASKSYEGMCKHEIALLLAYLIREGELQISQSGHVTKQATNGTNASSKDSAPLKYTSGSIEALMMVHANSVQRAANSSSSNEKAVQLKEPVELCCVISEGIDARSSGYYSNSGYWSLGLKISCGKTNYVVKNISELISAWRRSAYYSYGKNLAFVHSRNVFSDKANELLDELAPIVEAQRSMYGAISSKYSYESVNYSSKTIPLTQNAMAQILEHLIGEKLMLEIDDYNHYYGSKKKKATVVVKEENPHIVTEIVPVNGGYEVYLQPSYLNFIRGKNTLFALSEFGVLKTNQNFADKMGTICEQLFPVDNPLKITEKDMPAFCAAALGALHEYSECRFPDTLENLVPPLPEFTFRVTKEKGRISCRSTVEYGTTKLDLFEPALRNQPLRNIAAEVQAQTLVRQYFPYGEANQPDYSANVVESLYEYRLSYDPSFRAHKQAVPYIDEDNDEQYYELFTSGLRALSELGRVLISKSLSNVTVRRAPSVQVNAGINNGLLDIELHSDDMTPAELVSYLSSYERKKHFVRLSNGDIVRLDGSVKALAELSGGLNLSPEKLVEGVNGLPVNRTLFVDAILKKSSGVRFERNRAFKSIIREFDTIADQDISVPTGIHGNLRTYQNEGYNWLYALGKLGFGGILADDMGLGKTLQTITYLLARKNEGETQSAIVICPASLVYNWIVEIERFAPELDAVAIVGTKAQRRNIIENSSDHDVLVTSYDLLKRDIGEYEHRQFSCAVIDEAQYIKNSSTQSAKSVKLLQARNHFALTGTPIENRLGELWSIFDFLMPGVLGSEHSFEKRFAKPIAEKDESASKQLQSLVGPFILRRLKKDVLSDLPDKNESIVYANMEGEQEKLYRANEVRIAHLLSEHKPEEFAGMKLQILAELTQLRQICCDPHLAYDNYKGDSAKLETCMDMVRSAVDGGHRVLLFSQFTSMLEIIETRLQKDKIASFKLTGATSKEERARLVERFQAQEAPVFLISLKAGGLGLNLTAADIVIHYDPWWNIAAQNQATDRAHRIGQTKDVSVFKLIAKGTIEERIVDMQEKKRDLAESVLGGQAVESSSLTREDLLALLNA